MNTSGFLLSLARVVALGFTIVSMSACASVKVRKVPTPTQYPDGNWTEADQRGADAIEGVRFYLPRPWVNVFESFPVASDVYLAHGVISPDGQYIRIESLEADSPIPSLNPPVEPDDEIPASYIFRTPSNDSRGEAGGRDDSPPSGMQDTEIDARARLHELQQRLEQETAQRRASEQEAALANRRLQTAREQLASTPDGATTDASRSKVSNDNGAFAYLPLRGNMDILYLPDFDEQYAVESNSGLGNVNVAVDLGQGWSLQGLDSLQDNSRLNELIFGMLETAQAAAANVVTQGAAGLTELLAAGRDVAGRPETGQRLDEAQLPPGTPVTLRGVVVHYAATGLYPIIKPRELKGSGGAPFVLDLLSASGDEHSRALLTAINANNDAMVQAAVSKLNRVRGRMTVPVYPYQYISFNTFRYVRFETLTPAVSSFGDLYDRTGVRGETGSAQMADLAEIINQSLRRNFTPVVPPDEKPDPPDDPAITTQETLSKVEDGLARELRQTIEESRDSRLEGVELLDVTLEAQRDADQEYVGVTVWTAAELDADQAEAVGNLGREAAMRHVRQTIDVSKLADHVRQPVFESMERTIGELTPRLQSQLSEHDDFRNLGITELELTVNERGSASYQITVAIRTTSEPTAEEVERLSNRAQSLIASFLAEATLGTVDSELSSRVALPTIEAANGT